MGPAVILGVDVAVAPQNTGWAVAAPADGGWRVEAAGCGRRNTPLTAGLAEAVDARRPVLLCLDAPLGWPAALGAALAEHRAGEPLTAPPRSLFTRATDHALRERLGKRPLDVGADRIARTAHAALALLAALRHNLAHALPLITAPTVTAAGAVAETYPAGTLLAHGLHRPGYRRAEAADARRAIAGALAGSHALDASPVTEACAARTDTLDAVLCVAAGIDLLDGRAVPPDDTLTAAREGWIWCARGAD